MHALEQVLGLLAGRKLNLEKNQRVSLTLPVERFYLCPSLCLRLTAQWGHLVGKNGLNISRSMPNNLTIIYATG